MAKKIYVSPSDQDGNLYAAGNTNEAAQCQKISVALVAALKRCGFEAMDNRTDSMEDRVAESNRWGADLHVPVHTNAFNAEVQGTRLMAYDTSGAGYQACKAIMETLAPITPGTSDSITAWPGLYEVKHAAAPTAYIEVAFHDNPTEARWIIDNVEEIAEAICKGICNYYGYKYAAPGPAAPAPADVLYCVQVGAYKERANAEAQLAKVKAAGFDAYITTQTGTAAGSTEDAAANWWDNIKHFDREEFRCKCGGKYCNGYPAEPAQLLVQVADRVREHFGAPAIVSSGVRCKTHNANVGGVSNSRHMSGKAMDFCVRGKTAAQVLAYVQQQPEIRYAYAIDSCYVHMDVQ